jgi:hypothetical protein
MANRVARTSQAVFGWTWQAVLAGVFTSLTVQILLTMLGLGVGLLSIDIATADAAPAAAKWVPFVWWSVSGIIAAFVGGAIAAANAPDQTSSGRVAHALGAWAVTIVVVVAASGLMAGTAGNVAGNLAGPSYTASARLAALSRPASVRETTGAARQTAPTQPQLDEARRQAAYAMLAGFFALLLGAGAAYAAGIATTGQAVRDAAEPIT